VTAEQGCRELVSESEQDLAAGLKGALLGLEALKSLEPTVMNPRHHLQYLLRQHKFAKKSKPCVNKCLRIAGFSESNARVLLPFKKEIILSIPIKFFFRQRKNRL